MTKQELRERATAARNNIDMEDKKKFSRQICENILGLPEIGEAKKIFSYAALPDETDLTFLHSFLKARNIDVAFPVSLPDGEMQAYFPKEDNAFTVGAYGITEPIPEKCRLADPAEFDLVIVPCVGFDRTCQRIGHGMGYYDRYLPKCTKAEFICAAFDAQRLERVITDEFDVKMDVVVTEKKEYRPK